MTDESVFLVSEVWLDPGKFEEFKAYRIKVLDLLEKFNPDFVYNGHAFEWALGKDNGELPTGIEVCRFETEEMAKRALEAIEKSGLLNESNMLFNKVRCYLARYEKKAESGA